MTHPLQENLAVVTDSAAATVCCTRCKHGLCQSGEDWRKAAKAKRSAPTVAGPLMQEFVGKLWLEQLLCPSCGALFESKMVEVS